MTATVRMTTMGNVITARKTYATVANAEKALAKACDQMGVLMADVRWMVAVSAEDPTRFVPTVLLVQPRLRDFPVMSFAHAGIMVVG
jgi:hypothetical protein